MRKPLPLLPPSFPSFPCPPLLPPLLSPSLSLLPPRLSCPLPLRFLRALPPLPLVSALSPLLCSLFPPGLSPFVGPPSLFFLPLPRLLPLFPPVFLYPPPVPVFSPPPPFFFLSLLRAFHPPPPFLPPLLSSSSLLLLVCHFLFRPFVLSSLPDVHLFLLPCLFSAPPPIQSRSSPPHPRRPPLSLCSCTPSFAGLVSGPA